MTIVFSTSSPVVSVAAFSSSNELLWSGSKMAPGRASGTALELLTNCFESTGKVLADVVCFVADIGPGSFTGTRVGVVLAKTFAWNSNVKCAGVPAFDLISADQSVIIPSGKREFFVRTPGETPVRSPEVPRGAVGYGTGDADVYPEANRLGPIMDRLTSVPPVALMPEYRMEPSISTPKRPLSRVGE